MRRLAILGSTGSIGTQTLDVVRALPDAFQVLALGTRRATPLFINQVREFHPSLVAFEGEGASEMPERLSLEAIAAHSEVDMVVVAIPGLASLGPTLAALKAGKAVALASKEALVVAGQLVMHQAARSGAPLLPVDSEHSALWQCLRGERTPIDVEALILTASGGPFRRRPFAELAAVTPAEALAHPTWRMGPKVTVDSATLMNKGFEVMEARWLYDVPYARIQVAIHPQSVVHSLVRFPDGTAKAQLSQPDMRLPIEYALTYPKRGPRLPYVPLLDLAASGGLTFEPLDPARYPCFRLAREAAERGETYPAVLNAADEEAVTSFLAGRIPFTAISRLVEDTLGRHEPIAEVSLDAITVADAWARRQVREWEVAAR